MTHRRTEEPNGAATVADSPGPESMPEPKTDQTPTRLLRYVVVTPARNEAAYIELTLQAMAAQTRLPERWVVVSDGSTDRTEEIVRKYCARHPWIELVVNPPRAERHFAGKVGAFQAGYAKLGQLDYDVIVSLDADLSFEADHFEYLLKRLSENPRLGVIGSPFVENGRSYDFRFSSVDHVSGACQVFRRKCFEEIGGYKPIREGGIDLVAVVTARMKGWQTRTFTERVCQHHRVMGTGNHGILMVSYRGGFHDYLMGVHPVWQFLRSCYQMSRRPLVIGGCLLLIGYLRAWMGRAKRPVTDEFVAFRRREQMDRLRARLLRQERT